MQPDFVEKNRIYCRVVSVDEKTKVNLNSFKFKVNINSLKKQFLFPEPEQVPVLKVTKPDKIGEFEIIVENKHVIPVEVNIFEKVIEHGKNKFDARFKSYKNIQIRPGDVVKFKEQISKRIFYIFLSLL